MGAGRVKVYVSNLLNTYASTFIDRNVHSIILLRAF